MYWWWLYSICDVLQLIQEVSRLVAMNCVWCSHAFWIIIRSVAPPSFDIFKGRLEEKIISRVMLPHSQLLVLVFSCPPWKQMSGLAPRCGGSLHAASYGGEAKAAAQWFCGRGCATGASLLLCSTVHQVSVTLPSWLGKNGCKGWAALSSSDVFCGASGSERNKCCFVCFQKRLSWYVYKTQNNLWLDVVWVETHYS